VFRGSNRGAFGRLIAACLAVWLGAWAALPEAAAVPSRYDLVQIGELGEIDYWPVTTLFDVNNHGVVVGSDAPGGYDTSRAFSYNLNTGESTDIHTLLVDQHGVTGVNDPITSSLARSINDAGIVAGSVRGTAYWDTYPMVYDPAQPAGSQTTIDFDHRHQNGAAAAINESNRVVAGQLRIFDYDAGAINNANGPVFQGETWGTVYDMNNNGMAVGVASFSDAYMYDTHSGDTDVNSLMDDIAAGLGSTPDYTSLFSINDANVAVGRALFDDSGIYRLVAFSIDVTTKQVTDLSMLFDPGTNTSGISINNAGEILAHAYPGGVFKPVIIRGNAVVEISPLVTIPDALAGKDVQFESGTTMNDYGHILLGGSVDGETASFALIPQADAELDGATAETEYVPYGSLQGFGVAGLPEGSAFVGGGVSVEGLSIDDTFYTMQLFFNPQEVAALGIDPETLRLYWYDDDDSMTSWLLAGNPSNLTDNPDAAFVLGGPTDVLGDWGLSLDGNFVWANVDHASVFAAAGPLQTQTLPVPEPRSTMLIMLAGLLCRKRRRR